MMERTSELRTGNRYDELMVSHDMSAAPSREAASTPPAGTPGPLLVARLHVDLCRLASAMCPRGAAV
jgi:hypothetical protein